MQSLDHPFSDNPPAIGIFCFNDHRRKSIAKALQIDAWYFTYGTALAGRGFDKIIVFKEQDQWHKLEVLDWVDNLRTKLLPGGEFHII